LDADVLFQAAPARLLLGAAQAGLYRARWTERIVREVRTKLTAKGRLGALRAFEGNIGLVRDPLVEEFEHLAVSFPATHPDDWHVAAAAAAAGARYLVTGNLRHFDAGEAADHGFEVVHFDAFGERLALENLAALARAVDRTPPDRLYRYLDLLAVSMPRTFIHLQAVFADELAARPQDGNG
jgi:hypothetical protein